MIFKELDYNNCMSISDYLIKCVNNGYLRMDREGLVQGMGEVWRFIPNRKYGPGVLINRITGTVLSAAECSDRTIDADYNDWRVLQ